VTVLARLMLLNPCESHRCDAERVAYTDDNHARTTVVLHKNNNINNNNNNNNTPLVINVYTTRCFVIITLRARLKLKSMTEYIPDIIKDRFEYRSDYTLPPPTRPHYLSYPDRTRFSITVIKPIKTDGTKRKYARLWQYFFLPSVSVEMINAIIVRLILVSY
jgi:hypothetical protein